MVQDQTTPKQQARITIDQQLIHAGWVIQDKSGVNLRTLNGKLQGVLI